ncbi:MAG TPA: LysR family transcriptional regulator [Gemmataceae bacterium]|nr:LysR family transcriptional regulator [Gemmataceae bacterium]
MATFVTVVRTEGDATKAAETLNINQPSMSKRLAFLQHAGRILRRPWLERVGKTWHLTEEGRRVLPAVEELVHRYKLLTEAIEEARPAVVFGCGSAGAAGYVRQAVKLFRSRHPDATFRVSARPTGSRVEGVANGSLDMATVRLAQQEVQELARRPLYGEDLFDDPLVLAATPTAPGFDEYQGLADKTVQPKALTRFPLVLPEPDSGLRKDFDRRCRDAGIGDRLKVAVEVGPCQTALNYVKDGVGIGVLPRSVVERADGLVVKSLPPKLVPANTIRVICRKRAGSDELDLTEGAIGFLEALREAGRAMSA